MRYLDSATRDPADTLYRWLEAGLQGATYFGCQSGYFAYDGLFPFETHLRDLLRRSGELRLVVGGNEASLRSADLADVLELFESVPLNTAKSLTVAAADDLLMHPKTYYVEKVDGTRHAFVGSANLTHSGLGRNIEAAIALDSKNDPSAPFEEIRAAIDRWHLKPSANACLVDRSSLADLIDQEIVDQPRSPKSMQSPSGRRARAQVFPPLGTKVRTPRKKRVVALPPPSTRPARRSLIRGAIRPFPEGAVGIVKRLTALDTKGFNGKPGTLYIALPEELSNYLPMNPFGINKEPRTDITIEARIDEVPNGIARSGSSPTSITHVGAGIIATSHRDLRLNYLSAIRRQVADLASNHGAQVPVQGDLVAIEFYTGVRVRITFIKDTESTANLTPLLDQRGRKWGWLPQSTLLPWDDETDF